MTKTKNNTSNFGISVFRREEISKKKSILIRVIAIAASFLVSVIIASLICKAWPHAIIGKLFEGAFGTAAQIKKGDFSTFVVLIYATAILLGFGIAIVPVFKMKYWNMGANGQVLIACLAAILVMFYGADKLNNVTMIILSFVVAIVASIIWAVVPGIFKVFFNTNETLFTLMMNYLAMGLVAYANYVMAKGLRETPGVINMFTRQGWIVLKGFSATIQQYILPIIAVAIITAIIAVYMAKTKHGYEITVIGDSVNTAKYVGMNTKWITIRTLIVSGIITGIIGFLFATCVDHLASVNQCGSKGFTGILIAWLGNFNPLIMVGISFGLAFLDKGTEKITSFYRLGSNDLSSVIIGLIFFSVLISEFFIRYRILIKGNLFKKNKISMESSEEKPSEETPIETASQPTVEEETK